MTDAINPNPDDSTSNWKASTGDLRSLAGAILLLLAIVAGMCWFFWNLVAAPVLANDFPNLHILPSQSSERMEIQDWLRKSDKAEFVSYVSNDTNAVPTLVMVKDKSDGLTHKCDILTYSYQDGSHPTAALVCDDTHTPTYTVPLSNIPK